MKFYSSFTCVLLSNIIDEIDLPLYPPNKYTREESPMTTPLFSRHPGFSIDETWTFSHVFVSNEKE